MKTKILVCCHKQDFALADDTYLPLHVGKALSEKNLGIQGDDTGDNISLKNRNYCELTGLYWAWKNLTDADYIGLCHYRRYFDFTGKMHRAAWFTDEQTFVREYTQHVRFDECLMHDCDIVLAKPRYYPCSLFTDYCICHVSDDMRTVERIIAERWPEYSAAFNSVMHHRNRLSPYNMLVCNHATLNAYCTWLFDILGEAEKRINLDNYSDVQKRIYGYMAERLLNVFVQHNRLRVKYCTVFTLKDEPNVSARRNFFGCINNRVTTLLFWIIDRVLSKRKKYEERP